MPKEDLEQDTKLLGTRGYAPPEQYGFAQTDARADIYALGVTLKQLLGDKSQKPRYRRIIQKCTNLNPDKRYQFVRQVKSALSRGKYSALYGCVAILLLALFGFGGTILYQAAAKEELPSESGELVVLPAPDNPHWNGETGIAIWGNVPESGVGDGEVAYHWRLYRKDTAPPPDPDRDMWENGFYYFFVSADGDGVTYASSPYVISDAFEYTGEFAPTLPAPTGLEWKMFETDRGREYYATFSNLDDYEDTDSFNVWVYDKDGNYVMNNIWTKEGIMSVGYNGIRIRQEYLTDLDGAYRFVIEAYSSRPNEYKSYLMPDPVPEECYSPWYYRYK